MQSRKWYRRDLQSCRMHAGAKWSPLRRAICIRMVRAVSFLDSFPIKTLLVRKIRGGKSQFPVRHFSGTTRRFKFRFLCVFPISLNQRGEC